MSDEQYRVAFDLLAGMQDDLTAMKQCLAFTGGTLDRMIVAFRDFGMNNAQA